MKKLSILVALILCVTIGGVYATWIYIGGDLDPAKSQMSVDLASATNDTASGTLSIESNTIRIMIDQKDQDPEGGYDYTAVTEVTGEVVIRFTPHLAASETVQNNGVDSVVYIDAINSGTYGGKEIFSTSSVPLDIEWGTATNGYFEVTLTAEQVKGLLNFGSFELDTHNKYTDFQTALSQVNLEIVLAAKTNTLSE
ncbi:MAG: hypothetical protein IJW40_01235 [Clostridia bacterium]|nr:hypothetical protein [Clostridia bacterium]